MILTISMLKERYSDYANPLDKIKRDADEGKLFRLTRGLYEDNRNAEPMFLAAPILSPSYISFEFALSLYGFIPERVYAITSATLMVRKNKTFTNKFGRFTYSDIPLSAYPYGITIMEQNGYAAKVATKEKTLCDCLYKWSVVQSVKDLKILLFEDKRIDEEEFKSLDFKELIELASLYRKRNLELLIKLIKKEYIHE